MKIVIAFIIIALLYLPILPGRCVRNAAVLALSSHVHHHKLVQTSNSLRRSRLAANLHNSRKARSTSRHVITTNAHEHHSHRFARQVQLGSSARKHAHVQAKARYAYPMSLFLYEPPSFDSSSLSEDLSQKIKTKKSCNG